MTQDKKEEKIRKAFAPKDWNNVKASDSWHIFKIMSEFVNGFEKMQQIITFMVKQIYDTFFKGLEIIS